MRVIGAVGAGSCAVWVSRPALRVATPPDPADAVVLLATVAAIATGARWLIDVMRWTVALRRDTTASSGLPGSRRLAQLLLLLVSLSTSCITDTNRSPSMVLIDGHAGNQTTFAATAAASTVDPMTTTTLTSTTSTTSTVPTITGVPTTTEPDTPETTDPADNDQPGANRDPDEPDPDEPDPDEPAPSIPAHQVIVRPGDNLWSISVEALAHHGMPNPSTSTIARYWRLVVSGNHVRSGDPDLIVPGETIDLPAHEFSP